MFWTSESNRAVFWPKTATPFRAKNACFRGASQKLQFLGIIYKKASLINYVTRNKVFGGKSERKTNNRDTVRDRTKMRVTWGSNALKVDKKHRGVAESETDAA